MKRNKLKQIIKECIQEVLSSVETFETWKQNHVDLTPEEAKKQYDSYVKKINKDNADMLKSDKILEATTDPASNAIQSWLDRELEKIKKLEAEKEKDNVTEITDAEREAAYARRLKVSDKPQTALQKAISQGIDNKELSSDRAAKIRGDKERGINRAIPQQTKTYKNLPMSDSEYERLLQTTAKTTPKDSTFDVAHNMMYDPRVKDYVTKAARIDGVLPIERLQWDLENYVK